MTKIMVKAKEAILGHIDHFQNIENSKTYKHHCVNMPKKLESNFDILLYSIIDNLWLTIIMESSHYGFKF